jgi:hypothetical protein
LVLLIVYTLSSTKLEIRAKWFLPGSEGAGGERESVEGRGGRNNSNIVCIKEIKKNKQKKKMTICFVIFTVKKSSEINIFTFHRTLLEVCLKK